MLDGKLQNAPEMMQHSGAQSESSTKIAAGGACDAIEFLLTPDSEQGCSLDVTDNEGNTAWHVAAEGGHIKAVQCLLKEGAQLESTNHAGCTALHIAARSGELIHCIHLICFKRQQVFVAFACC